jgi:predicted ArsR family transcriptional regulator
MSTKPLAKVVGLSTRAVRKRLNSLVARGMLVAIGTGPLDPRRQYQLKEIM